MTFLDDLEAWIREHDPELATARAAEGGVLRIAEPDGLDQEDAPEVHLQMRKDSVLLDWVWRLPLRDGQQDDTRTFILEYAKETIENHGWEVPVLLRGGPLNGRTLTKRREDLVGRLLFARPPKTPDAPHAADVYKWRLRRNAQGEYVCHFDQSLVGDELDRFIARGVESTGPFVVIQEG